MKALTCLASTILAICCSGIVGAVTMHRCGSHHFPDSTARAYSVDSIRSYFSQFSRDSVNLYRVRPGMWRDIPKTVGNFNKLYIFNEDGSTVQLHDPKRCANISAIIEHNLPSTFNRSQYFESFIQMSEALSLSTWQRNRFTAMIFWSRAIGLPPQDCPFEWARQLRFKYGNSIQIIWVNTDIGEDATIVTREEDLQKMTRYLSKSIPELY